MEKKSWKEKIKSIFKGIGMALFVFVLFCWPIIPDLLWGDFKVAGAYIAFLAVVGLISCAAFGIFTPAPPKSPPRPPAGYAKFERHSPEELETLIFDGEYDGSLNKEFENKE